MPWTESFFSGRDEEMLARTARRWYHKWGRRHRHRRLNCRLPHQGRQHAERCRVPQQLVEVRFGWKAAETGRLYCDHMFDIITIISSPKRSWCSCTKSTYFVRTSHTRLIPFDHVYDVLNGGLNNFYIALLYPFVISIHSKIEGGPGYRRGLRRTQWSYSHHSYGWRSCSGDGE